MPEGKSERPPFELVEAAVLAIDGFPDDIEKNHSEIVYIVVNALLAEREAERARCNAILKEAFGVNMTVGALVASIADRWQPIETAPRNYKPIWGCDSERGFEAKVCHNGTEWECISHDNFPMGIGFYPTHWMPLPSFPSSTEES